MASPHVSRRDSSMTEAAPHRPAKKPVQFGFRSLLAIVAILAGLFAGYGWLHRTVIAPSRHADEIERLLRSLVACRPADMTRGQWGCAVAWTLNLHSNSMLMFEADVSAIAAFEQRLKDRLAGDVDMQTIDWIWTQYAQLCPHGASYQRLKPQMLEEIQTVGPRDDPWGMNVP